MPTQKKKANPAEELKNYIRNGHQPAVIADALVELGLDVEKFIKSRQKKDEKSQSES